jgi:phosphoserine phosphatase
MIVDWIGYLSNALGLTKSHEHNLAALVNLYVKKQVSYNEFATTAVTIYAEALCGQSAQDVDKIADLFVQRDFRRLFPFSAELLRLVKRRRYGVFILSGAPLIPILAYAKLIPIDFVYAVDVLRNERDTFTDKLATNYALKDNKQHAITQLQSEGFEITLAFGDTESDRPLLEVAKHPFFVLQSQAQGNAIGFPTVTPATILSSVNQIIGGETIFNGRNFE